MVSRRVGIPYPRAKLSVPRLPVYDASAHRPGVTPIDSLLRLQRSIGNAAVVSLLGASGRPGPQPVIRRAIAIGDRPLPRTDETPAQDRAFLRQEGLVEVYQQLNSDRTNIYIFSSNEHLLAYLRGLANKAKGQPAEAVPEPFVHRLAPQQVDEAHRTAQDIRFSTVFQPGVHQIPDHGSGAHNIPGQMMPPSGLGHYWGQATSAVGGSQPEYTIYANTFTAPTPTQPYTFGDPSRPSLTMSQGGQNIGMHIQPTSNPAYVDHITRPESTYAGLDSVTGRVRGHPLALENNQRSTDMRTTMDRAAYTYTDESDSTKEKGGISSWRYNEIEKPAINSGYAFTQINAQPSSGSMGIIKPDTMYYRRGTSGGSEDLTMDNSGATNYRVALPPKKRRQAWMSERGRAAAARDPYPTPQVRRPGEDFDDPDSGSYSGYMSPPPTPFLSLSTLAPEQDVVVPGRVHVHSRVVVGGQNCMVTDVFGYNRATNETRCRVREIPSTYAPGFV